MTLDETKYDAALLSNYDDIAQMLTAGSSSQNLFEDVGKGLAQDIATTLGTFTDSKGMINSRETTATSKLSDHEEALTKLEERMDVVYNRYLQQFGAMETLMVTLDSTRDYLTSQFETLSKAYEVD